MAYEEIDSIKSMLENVEKKLAYEKISGLNEDEKKEYDILLKKLEESNSSKQSTHDKGKALEEIATFVLKTSHIFDVYGNVRTSTNELDQLVKVKEKDRCLIGWNIIDKRYSNFIGECKNYDSKVSVTYVGKICSLLLTTQNKLCILFSYYGVTGEKWADGTGLIKKFYLSKEKEEDRFCIIDFNINDFKEISKGGNLLTIISNKILALKNDTSYYDLLTPHEATVEILKCQKSE